MGTSEATDDSPSGISEATGESPSGTFEATGDSPSGISEATGDPPSGTFEATDDSPSGTSEAIDDPPSGTSEATDDSPSGTSEATDFSPIVISEANVLPSSTSKAIGDSPSGNSEANAVSPSGTSNATDDSPSGTSKATDYSPSGTSKATDDSPSGTSKATDDSPSGTSEATDDSPSGTFEATGDSPSGNSEATGDSPSGTSKATDDSPSGNSEATDDSPSGTSVATGDSPSGTSKATDDSPSGTSEATDDSPIGTSEATADSPRGTSTGASYSVNNCSTAIATQAQEGVVHWNEDPSSFPRPRPCLLQLTVAQGHYIEAFLDAGYTCVGVTLISSDDSLLRVYNSRPVEVDGGLNVNCEEAPIYPAITSTHSQMFFKATDIDFPLDLVIHFRAVPNALRNKFRVTWLTSSSGYVTPPGYNGVNFGPKELTDITFSLNIPDMVVSVMISLEQPRHNPRVSVTQWFTLNSIVDGCSVNYLELFDNELQLWRKCGYEIDSKPELYNASVLTLHYYYDNMANVTVLPWGFRMRFTFHQETQVPVRLPSGLFDCSVEFYPTFQDHVRCNLDTECEGGEDELGCPFSSVACGPLTFQSGNKCFFAVTEHDQGHNPQSNQLFHNNSRSYEATDIKTIQRQIQLCGSRGGSLATVQSEQELKDVKKLLGFRAAAGRCRSFMAGTVHGQRSVPNTYSKVRLGLDKTVIYRSTRQEEITEAASIGTFSFMPPDVWDLFNLPFKDDELISAGCAFFEFDKFRGTLYHSPNYLSCYTASCGAVCQTLMDLPVQQVTFTLDGRNDVALAYNVSFPPSLSSKRPTYTRCPKGHLTHAFLACDIKVDCGVTSHVTECSFPAGAVSHEDRPIITSQAERDREQRNMDATATVLQPQPGKITDTHAVLLFQCNDGGGAVHFTQVCDFWQDCQDKSDEQFCRHPPCAQFTCTSGQCVNFGQLCDHLRDCVDGSDEDDCFNRRRHLAVTSNVPSNPLVTFTEGSFAFSELGENEPCPDTHYRCLSEPYYCLPVYTRCNGYYDCIDREDENDCDNVTCPGFYRCRDSVVCVHVDHLCDSEAQCPQRDDEWLCQEKPCPEGCMCHGLAFVCSHIFSVSSYPQLRYLDASGSNTSLADLGTNSYLVYLVLTSCGLTHVPRVNGLVNLRHLDLSYNSISSIDMNIFLGMISLKELSLANNPLLSMVKRVSSVRQRNLGVIDLSNTNLTTFTGGGLSHFTNLRFVNLSRTSIHSIEDDGFQQIPLMVELDLRGSPVQVFPAEVFGGLTRLQRLFTDNYKFCCEAILPPHFDGSSCFAPQNELSSCNDLLHSETYRAFLWLMSSLSIIGNIMCLVFRICLNEKHTHNAFNVFVLSLCLADFIMGVYVSIIGTADQLLRGQFLFRDKAWMSSVPCQIAGFLCLLSSEVSALTVLLITLDRFVVLRFPFSTLRFTAKSATCTCAVLWLAGFLLAAVPLLPITSHWQFYSQTGICIPLPVTRQEFLGRSFSFGVFIVLNFVLFLIVAAGQVLIYWSVRKNSMGGAATTKKRQDATIARRLTTVVVTNFLCWFPIGLCGVLSLAGLPISGEVNVGLAIFALPVNAAFNPFLYTYNVAMERRRLASEERIKKELQLEIEQMNAAPGRSIEEL